MIPPHDDHILVLLYEELDEEAQHKALAHLQECPSCAQKLRDYQLIHQEAQLLAQAPGLSEDCNHKLIAFAESQAKRFSLSSPVELSAQYNPQLPEPRLAHPRWFATFSLAAALTLIATGVWLMTRSQETHQAHSSVSHTVTARGSDTAPVREERVAKASTLTTPAEAQTLTNAFAPDNEQASPPPVPRLEDANTLLEQKRFEEAFQLLTLIIEAKSPDSLEAHLLRADCSQALNHHLEAINDLRFAIEAGIDNPSRAQLALAISLEAVGNSDESKSILERLALGNSEQASAAAERLANTKDVAAGGSSSSADKAARGLRVSKKKGAQRSKMPAS
ncbi:MAG: hypothetical protein RBU37_15670, partial [Myxococcota bacterium]|nr:hypothetical protein [Myxococcota bacterium]